MFLVQKITDNAWQKQTLVLDSGASFSLEMYFRPLQQGWFINQLIYQDFTLNGLRITNSPNMLHQWRNLLPFGLGCFSTANREPSLAQDFSSGASKLYVLSQTEVQQYTDFVQGTVTVTAQRVFQAAGGG